MTDKQACSPQFPFTLLIAKVSESAISFIIVSMIIGLQVMNISPAFKSGCKFLLELASVTRIGMGTFEKETAAVLSVLVN